jgi:transposase
MVRRHISNESKKLALSMSLQGICDIEICKLMGISEHSVKWLRRTYRNTDAVSCKPVAPGQPRLLSSMEVKVCHTGIYMMCMSLT